MTHIIEPPQSAKSCIIWMHGLGADCYDFVDIVPHLQLATTRFVFPNAPWRPITINHHIPCRAWYDIYALDRIEREDETGIRQSQQLINALIAQQINAGLPSQKIVLAGFSQGGAMALFTGLRYDKPLAGIMGLSCYLPCHTALADEATQANVNTAIWLAHGQQDEVIPYQIGHRTYQWLRDQHYAVSWQNYPMGHQVCAPEIEACRLWLQQRLN